MTERGITKCEERMGTVAIRESLFHMKATTSQITSRRTTDALDPMEDKVCRGGHNPKADTAAGVEQQSRLTVIHGGSAHRMEQPFSTVAGKLAEEIAEVAANTPEGAKGNARDTLVLPITIRS